jgi:hypothetical protein
MGEHKMKELRTEIEINAPSERVWQILTDPAKFPEWNPFIHQLNGQIKQGAHIEVKLGDSPDKTMTFKPTILEVTPNHTLRWLGKLFIGGLFDGEHIFEIEPLGPDRVRFIQREKFNGILVPVFNFDSTKRGFERMNQALKARAESNA